MLAGDDILSVDKVSKIYSRRRGPTQRRLGAMLKRVILGQPFNVASTTLMNDEFFAVKDVSFSLRRGEALGIIGLNGSGKTTLLRMLAGQILPDSGQIAVTGHTASMIDLTAGFQPLASGRENVFFRGAALGRSKAEMESLYDEIVEFSELGDAIDAPVASYSSGMTMRLAFSIMSATAPDLLFIDEILAVGDFRFKQKCLARVRELREHSVFVMVSHSMRDIMRFCDRTIVLHHGEVAFFGNSVDAVHFFETEIDQQTAAPPERALSRVVGPTFENYDSVEDVQAYWSDAEAKPVTEIDQGKPLYFYVSFKCKIQTRNLIIGIPVYGQDGTFVTGFSTDHIFRIDIGADGYVRLLLTIPEFYFNGGNYHSNFVIVDGSEFLWRKPNAVLRVSPRVEPYWGVASIPYAWKSL